MIDLDWKIITLFIIGLLLLCYSCGYDKNKWEDITIEDLKIKVAYPKSFNIVDPQKIEIEINPIPEHEERIYFKDSLNSSYFYLIYDERKDWPDSFMYEASAITKRTFYEGISDSLRILTEESRNIQGNKFNFLEIIFSEKSENELYYYLELWGVTENEYEFAVRYKAICNKEWKEFQREAIEIINRLEFDK